MFGIRLRQFQCGWIGFCQIHSSQMCPEYVDLAASEPIPVCQSAEDSERQQVGFGRGSPANVDKTTREKGVHCLDEHFPHEKHEHTDGGSRNVSSKLAKRLFKRFGRFFHLATFES